MQPLLIPRQGARHLKVLCLGAHADDIEIGCGGTILRLLRDCAAADVYWVIFSGDGVRRREARASAKTFLGGAAAQTVRTWTFRESYFPQEWALIKDAVETIRREFSPDIVFTHYRDDRHQDHRVVSDLTWNTFRDHVVLEYEIPKYDGDLSQPNFFVSLDRRACARKIKAIVRCFRSQAAKHWFTEDTFRAMLRLRGVECASPTGFAEAFYARKLLW